MPVAHTWLARFGPQPPSVAVDLAAHLDARTRAVDVDAVCSDAQALAVLRAHQGCTIGALLDDLLVLRDALPCSPAAVALVDAMTTAATTAYVEELTAILESRATRDPLTGLPNRAAFTEALGHEVRGRGRGAAPALLLIDLDGFKGVNDTDGHLAGDAVLVGVANLLGEQVRRSDVACRLGGDEFAVVLPRTSLSQATKIARRLLDAARHDDRLASASARVRLSIGVAWLSAPESADTLVALADQAMYAAKSAGGDAIHAVRALAAVAA